MTARMMILSKASRHEMSARCIQVPHIPGQGISQRFFTMRWSIESFNPVNGPLLAGNQFNCDQYLMEVTPSLQLMIFRCKIGQTVLAMM